MWNETLELKHSFILSWCLGGDFNEIKAIGERSGCTRIDSGMRDFQDFINSMEIIDLPMVGWLFTCSRSEYPIKTGSTLIISRMIIKEV